MNNTDRSEISNVPNSPSDIKQYIWIFVVVFLAWLCGGFAPSIFSQCQSSDELSRSGLFGDSFGFINSLFSGFAFAGVIVAIFMQRRELQLQREQLELQREEMRASTIELKRSAEAQEKTEKALMLSAYLSATTAELQGHASRMDRESKADFRPSTDLHDDMLFGLMHLRNIFISELPNVGSHLNPTAVQYTQIAKLADVAIMNLRLNGTNLHAMQTIANGFKSHLMTTIRKLENLQVSYELINALGEIRSQLDFLVQAGTPQGQAQQRTDEVMQQLNKVKEVVLQAS